MSDLTYEKNMTTPNPFLELAVQQALTSGGKSLLELKWNFGDTIQSSSTTRAAWVYRNALYVIDRTAGETSVYVCEAGEERGTGSLIVGLGVPCWEKIVQTKKDPWKPGICSICKDQTWRYFSKSSFGSTRYCSLKCYNVHEQASRKLLKLDNLPLSTEVDPDFFDDITKCSTESLDALFGDRCPLNGEC